MSEIDSYYKLSIEKLNLGCKENKLGSTNTEYGTSPKEIQIDESEALHLVQLLYILKERCWDENEWCVFTKKDMLTWVSQERMVYLENKSLFGETFVDGFKRNINYFIENFCSKMQRC